MSRHRTRAQRTPGNRSGRRGPSIGGLQHTGELDLLDTKQSMPVGLVPKAVLKRPLRVLLAQVDVDRFGIAGFDERVKAHEQNAIPLAVSEQALQLLDGGDKWRPAEFVRRVLTFVRALRQSISA